MHQFASMSKHTSSFPYSLKGLPDNIGLLPEERRVVIFITAPLSEISSLKRSTRPLRPTDDSHTDGARIGTCKCIGRNANGNGRRDGEAPHTRIRGGIEKLHRGRRSSSRRNK